jgi:hypothetical protein
MEISPKVSIWINVVLAILTAISTGALSLSGLVSNEQAAQIVAISGLIVTVLNIIMHSYASSQPGPAAPADPPVVVAATRVANLPSDASVSAVKEAKSEATEAVAAHQP